LNSNIESGISPLDAYFSVDTAIPNAVTTYQLEYNYDGVPFVPDYSDVNFDNVMHLYDTEGVYYPAIAVTDDQDPGNTYYDMIGIVVLNKDEIDGLLRAKWEGMISSLAQNDIDTAVKDFDISVADDYKEMFTILSSILPQISSDLADIQLIEKTDNLVEYDIKVFRNGNEYSFYLEFSKDNNGIWRIISF